MKQSGKNDDKSNQTLFIFQKQPRTGIQTSGLPMGNSKAGSPVELMVTESKYYRTSGRDYAQEAGVHQRLPGSAVM